MAAKRSAGLLPYREVSRRLEVFLVHPGGPFWAKKDEGAWSIPKGEIEGDEDPLAAAVREVREETGFSLDAAGALALGSLRQPGGKVVEAWAVEADFNASLLVSNTFPLEWPPKSGRHQEIPEVDRGLWLSLEEARAKILRGQAELLDRLEKVLAARAG